VRTRKGVINPVYAEINKESIGLAHSLLKLFHTHIGKRKGEIAHKALAFEATRFDYRLVRGLLLILQRRSNFQVRAAVDPILARRTIFERASKEGFVSTSRMRMQVLHEAAVQLGVSNGQLEDAFYADLDDQLVLTKFTPISPGNLLKQYNLSLTQTLFFKSTFMEVKVSDHWKEVLRAVKFRGLMYSAETHDGVFQITVDGPLSLFKLTQRYGTSLAKVLPTIVHAKSWEIRANVIRLGERGKRILRLKLSSEEVGDMLRPEISPAKAEPSFDSLVERRFHRDFAAMQSEWKLTREPEPLIVDKHVFIPDFSFERNGVRVFMEIAGFWTENYLKRKIKKLQQLKGVDILVAADEKLACDKLKALGGKVIFYKGRVPLKPSLTYLASRAQQFVQVEVDTLNLQGVRLRSNIVEVQILAKSLGVSEEALMRKLREVEVKGYTLVGNLLVRNEELQQVQSKIFALKEPTLAEVISVIETQGIDQPYDVLSTLGYAIKWSGLDLDQSTIYKRDLQAK
jgi:predicted nuclease of restriction endonuclease-like RecB superfamily